MAVDWTKPLRTVDGRRATLEPPFPGERRRRVSVPNHKRWSSEAPATTTMLYPESGIARTDGRPSDDDLVGSRE